MSPFIFDAMCSVALIQQVELLKQTCAFLHAWHWFMITKTKLDGKLLTQNVLLHIFIQRNSVKPQILLYFEHAVVTSDLKCLLCMLRHNICNFPTTRQISFCFCWILCQRNHFQASFPYLSKITLILFLTAIKKVIFLVHFLTVFLLMLLKPVSNPTTCWFSIIVWFYNNTWQ